MHLSWSRLDEVTLDQEWIKSVFMLDSSRIFTSDRQFWNTSDDISKLQTKASLNFNKFILTSWWLLSIPTNQFQFHHQCSDDHLHRHKVEGGLPIGNIQIQIQIQLLSGRGGSSDRKHGRSNRHLEPWRPPRVTHCHGERHFLFENCHGERHLELLLSFFVCWWATCEGFGLFSCCRELSRWASFQGFLFVCWKLSPLVLWPVYSQQSCPLTLCQTSRTVF